MTARVLQFGLALLLAMFAAEGALAQDPAAPPLDDGSIEGIAVHGHWTVTVVREGEVVERREFENALQAGGQSHLTNLLARSSSPGPWTLLVEADGSGTLCANNEFILGTDTDCTISETEAELTATDNNATVVLEGSDTVQRDGNLERVHTWQWWCGSSTAPADCAPTGQNRAQVTMKALAPVIPVQNGDRIEVTVELSFN